MSLAGNTDPIKVGERLLRYRELHPTRPFHEVADMIPWDDPDLAVAEEETSGQRAARERQAELEARASNGDRFAMALLSGATLAEDPVD